MSRFALAIAAVTAVSLAFAGVAGASLPRPKTTRIVPLSSIAGVKLGMTASRVKAQWRVAGQCSGSGEQVCLWNDGPYERASVRFRKGKVVQVGIGGQTAACTINPFVFPTLKAWRTSSGLGLLSSRADVASKLPGVTGNGSEAVPFQVRRKAGGKTVRFALNTGALTSGGFGPGCGDHGPPADPFKDTVTALTLAYFP